MRRAVVRTHGIAAVLPDPALLADAGPRVAAVPVVPAVQRAELRAARAAIAAPTGHALTHAVRAQPVAAARLAVWPRRAGLGAAVPVLEAWVALAGPGRRVAGAVAAAQAAIPAGRPGECIVHLLLFRREGIEVAAESEDLSRAATAAAAGVVAAAARRPAGALLTRGVRGAPGGCEGVLTRVALPSGPASALAVHAQAFEVAVVFTLVQAGTASRARETGLAFALLRSRVAEAVSCAWRVAHTACTDAGRAVEAGYAVALAVLARSVAGAQGVWASELDRTVITAPACIADTLAGVVTSPVPATAAPHAAVNAEEAGKTQARAFLAVALVRALVRAYVEARGPAIASETVARAVVAVPAVVAVARAAVVVELAQRGRLLANVNSSRG